MSHDDGGPAYPHDGQANYTGGMTLLDWFAGMALVAFLPADPRSNPFLSPPGRRTLPEWIAKDAYDYAAAMIAEKRRREENR